MTFKLGVASACLVSIGLACRIANATPPFVSTEDALRDGDVDTEDLASARALSPRPPRAAPTELGLPRLTLLPGSRSSTWITVGGFSRETPSDRREIGGFVVLGLPLDRFARGSRTTTFLPSTIEGDGGLELVQASATSPASSPPTERDFDLSLTPRLARASVEAAWHAGGFGSDESALDAIVSRAHWSAALPEARLRAVRYDDASLSLEGGTDTSHLQNWAGANLGLEARLTWRLDRLLYADDEPAFERIRLEHRDARGRIAAKVLEALFHWQRAILDLRTLPPTQLGTRDEADVLLRVMEAEAALDVLTDGWFGAHKTARVVAVEKAAARRDPARVSQSKDARDPRSSGDL